MPQPRNLGERLDFEIFVITVPFEIFYVSVQDKDSNSVFNQIIQCLQGVHQ